MTKQNDDRGTWHTTSKCPACDVEVSTDVKLSIGATRPDKDGGLVVEVDIASIDYEPMLAHYNAVHS